MARYGFSAFIIIEFGGRSIPCGDDNTDESSINDICPMAGSDVISSYGIEGVWTNVWLNVWILLVIQIVLRVSTYVLLRRDR